jgi:hypothetical protein
MNENTIWLAVAIVVLGTAAALWARKRIKLQHARTWPMAVGQVESTSVRLESDVTQQSRYIAEIVYSYTLQGQKYSGRLRRSFMLHGRAHKWIGGYANGRVLSIRYDPANAKDSVLFEDEQAGAQAA